MMRGNGKKGVTTNPHLRHWAFVRLFRGVRVYHVYEVRRNLVGTRTSRGQGQGRQELGYQVP